LVGLLLEFIQICSFAFNQHAPFTGSEQLRRMHYTAQPFDNGGPFDVMYWIMFAISFSPYIFVVVVRIIIYAINAKKGEVKASIFVQTYQQKIYAILWFLVNTLYLPVLATMLSGLDCTFTDTTLTLDSDPTIQCLSRRHVPYIVCSLIALVMYYPAASFAQAQTQNISDIKFKPKVVFIFAQFKLVLAGMLFFTNHVQPFLAVIVIVQLAFIVVNLWLQPCLIKWINQMRTVFFTISFWSSICSCIALSPDINPKVPLGLLIAGWVAISVSIPALYFLFPRLYHATKDRKEITS